MYQALSKILSKKKNIARQGRLILWLQRNNFPPRTQRKTLKNKDFWRKSYHSFCFLTVNPLSNMDPTSAVNLHALYTHTYIYICVCVTQEWFMTIYLWCSCSGCSPSITKLAEFHLITFIEDINLFSSAEDVIQSDLTFGLGLLYQKNNTLITIEYIINSI